MIQSFLKSIGDNGCFFLCLLKTAYDIKGKDFMSLTMIELYRLVDELQLRKLIQVDMKNLKDEDNFFVLNSCELLSQVSGKNIRYKKIQGDELRGYKRKPNCHYIEEWKWKCYSHFKLPHFDPLQASQTVKNGKIVSLREYEVTH